jgi:peptidoglycan-associated lipoprotein
MLIRTSRFVLASTLIAVVAVMGCAKRPATTQASAPAPTGAAGSTGAAGTTAAARQGTSGMTGQPGQPGQGTAGGGVTGGAGGQSGVAGPGAGGGSSAGATTAAPPAARPQPREFSEVAELKDIYFDFDKYDIRPADARILDGNATFLKNNPNSLILIEGHCDERGTNEYNLALGERRAKSTMNYLVSQGIQANRITIISYGEERPLCTERSEECWAKNRRAHFLVKPR